MRQAGAHHYLTCISCGFLPELIFNPSSVGAPFFPRSETGGARIGLLPSGLLGTISYGAQWCRHAGTPVLKPISSLPADCLSARRVPLEGVAGLNVWYSSPGTAGVLQECGNLV
jgi:hypothetical protein